MCYEQGVVLSDAVDVIVDGRFVGYGIPVEVQCVLLQLELHLRALWGALVGPNHCRELCGLVVEVFAHEVVNAFGIVRELIGAGKIFGLQLMPSGYEPVTIFILAPGAFLVLAFIVAGRNKIIKTLEKKGKEVPKQTGGCAEGGCASCSGCDKKVFPTGQEG